MIDFDKVPQDQIGDRETPLTLLNKHSNDFKVVRLVEYEDSLSEKELLEQAPAEKGGQG